MPKRLARTVVSAGACVLSEEREDSHLFPATPRQIGGAVVIGGAQGGLGVVRSLGRHGIPVVLLAADYWLARFSRYVRQTFPSPDLQKQSQAADYVLDLAVREGFQGWAVFPCTDAAVEMVSRNYERLSRAFRLTTPPWELLRYLHDKRLTYERALEVGLDCPRTYHAHTLEEVAALKCRYPVILKPAFKQGRNALTMDKAWKADTRDTLIAQYTRACSFMKSDMVVVQEFIPGSGEVQYSYAALCQEGRAIASLVAKRLRQHPIDFGQTSTYVETVDQPELESISERFLLALRYSGLVELEFKMDARDDRYKLLDANPRVWAWHTLGNRGGIDFPFLMWRLLSGAHVPALRAKAGHAWVHISKDILAGFQEIRRGRLSPAKYVRSLLRPLEFAIAAADDPVPLLVDFPLLVRGALRRLI